MMTVGKRLKISKETSEAVYRKSTDNAMTKKRRRQAMINKTLNRKLKIEHY